jgi:hypothetical protein
MPPGKNHTEERRAQLSIITSPTHRRLRRRPPSRHSFAPALRRGLLPGPGPHKPARSANLKPPGQAAPHLPHLGPTPSAATPPATAR